MRVALELQPCCGNRSGVGNYTYELAKRLKNEGDLEFCGNLFNFCGRNDNAEALKGIDMPINESRVFPYGVYRRVWNVVPIPYQSLFPQKADLSIFFNYIVPPRVEGRVITTIYDMTYLRFPETMAQDNLRRIKNGIRSSIERSDHILTISEFSRQEICTLLNVPKEKVSIVYSAPMQGGAIADWGKVAGKFHISKPYLLYVGTIEPRKNLTRLIRAFEYLKQEHHIPHQLVLAGGSGWQNEEIYQTAKEVKSKHDILFTGYISQEEKNALYKHASVFVFPSLYEGFGMPPLEAMHFDCPAVCADAASLPEVVGDAARLVNPLDEVSIAEGLWHVLSDEAYAACLIQKGRERKNKFTWEHSARRMTEICKTVLGEI